MTDASDAILRAGLRDAETSLATVQTFSAEWRSFVSACNSGQLDVAQTRGERLIALVEVAVDLQLSSHRRLAQFMRLTQDQEP